MKQTASSISRRLMSVRTRAQSFSASAQIPITIFDDSASLCLQTMPMRSRAPRMKHKNHFLLYCFFWSRPTTVSQEKFSPALYALAYQVWVFRMVSN
jgi:hypothetical protein